MHISKIDKQKNLAQIRNYFDLEKYANLDKLKSEDVYLHFLLRSWAIQELGIEIDKFNSAREGFSSIQKEEQHKVCKYIESIIKEPIANALK